MSGKGQQYIRPNSLPNPHCFPRNGGMFPEVSCRYRCFAYIACALNFVMDGIAVWEGGSVRCWGEAIHGKLYSPRVVFALPWDGHIVRPGFDGLKPILPKCAVSSRNEYSALPVA